jgi:hypothetical protein
VRPSLSSPVVFVALERIINEHLIAPIWVRFNNGQAVRPVWSLSGSRQTSL